MRLLAARSKPASTKISLHKLTYSCCAIHTPDVGLVVSLFFVLLLIEAQDNRGGEPSNLPPAADIVKVIKDVLARCEGTKNVKLC